ncbi:MAG: hypothetical protein JW717_13995 [Marinilabiliaceae bacterium]|nr:hypothetical protein [Marinilabiliaceae bacterium]
MINGQINITADYREVPSKLPEMLNGLDIAVSLFRMKAGDYLINDEIIIERKTRDDFALSIIQGRLFNQCAKLKKSNKHVILLIEGNPYNTRHDIDRQAIKGALLSIAVCWQIPIIYSIDTADSAQMLYLMGKQLLKNHSGYFRNSKSPKNIKKKAVYFLQGLPSVGIVLAKLLLEKFGSVENVLLANENQLLEIEGIGKKKAEKIRSFITHNMNK